MESATEIYTRPKTRRPGEQATCQDCCGELSDTNWTPSMQKYRRYICAPCWSARQRRYEANTPDLRERKRAAVKARQASWSPERVQREADRRYGAWLMRKYGIDLTAYREMLAEQGGACAICRTDCPDGRGRFHVDHCHATGRVRGLLCATCNMLLGMAEDSTERLAAAIDYLNRPAARPDHQPAARAAAGGKTY